MPELASRIGDAPLHASATPIHFPPVIGVSELSLLLGKTPMAILADRCRAPHRVPPSCEPPGSRQPLWILEDVIAWLRGHQRPVTPVPSPPPRRGRPTKREQLERQAAKAAQQGKGGAQ